jgi:hypothetical protein
VSVHEIDEGGEVPLERATRLFGTVGTNVKSRGSIGEVIFDLAPQAQFVSLLGKTMSHERKPVGRNIRDLYLKIVKRFGRLRSRGRRRNGMGERAIVLDEFPRLAKSGYGLLFVSSRIDGNGDDLVETVSTQVRDIPEKSLPGRRRPRSGSI